MIREGSLDQLIHLPPQWVEEAKPDSLWQMLILAGFNEVAHLKGELLSYQVPTYYGLITAIYR
ncbi:conserved hypothetical protein [[Clostridium] ultunense Esp]|nr:conserved hypothetical protein [[Clostridium] ultunense Esp]